MLYRFVPSDKICTVVVSRNLLSGSFLVYENSVFGLATCFGLREFLGVRNLEVYV